MKRLLMIVGIVAIIFGFSVSSIKASNNANSIFENDSTIAYQKLQIKTGLNFGWDYPYSTGIDVSLLFNELVDCNIGVGLGVSGAKLGLGIRLFPIRNRKISPMFGVYYYHATGLKNLIVTVYEDEATYDITPDNAVLLNTGMRYRFGKGHYIIAGIGYSIPFAGDKALYRYGSTATSVENLANSFGTGGLSLNIGILLKMNRGDFIIK